LKKRTLALMLGLATVFILLSCGGGKKSGPPSSLTKRVLASQSVTAAQSFGRLVIVNGLNDSLPRASPLAAGSSPGLMVMSPTRNIVVSVDSATNTLYGVNTAKENVISNVRLPGPTSSIVVPSADTVAYAAVPTATISGFAFIGAIEVVNFNSGAFTSIAVNNAQTVVSDDTGTKLLVFSGDSDSVTVLTPGLAVPPVDTSCYSLPSVTPVTGVCEIVPGFDRPVSAVVTGSTAYVLNCGAQCGGSQASVAVFDLATLTITKTIPVDAATIALLSGSTLYVAGTSPSPANNTCAGQTTAATVCGRLDVIDTGSKTVTTTAVITDGYHQRMDLTSNGQLFIGARDCTSIGNSNNPSGGEVRGCLSIYRTVDASVVIPSQTGNVDGLQGFTSRSVEYVAQGGKLNVYDTNRDILLINNFLPQGSINIVGYVADVKAIDFF
jgi:hypothetical protein